MKEVRAVPFMLPVPQRDLTTVFYQSRKYSEIPVILQIHWIQTNDEYTAHAAIRCGVLAQGSTLPTTAPLFLSKSPRKSVLYSHVMRRAFTTRITTGY